MTSEPVDLKPSSSSGEPITTATGGANQPSSAGQAGAAGGPGAAGSDPTGAAGTAGAGGSAGAGAAAGSGGSPTSSDAGAVDGAANKDARPASDAASAEVTASAETWTNIYTRMLNNQGYASNCTGGGCHNPGSQKGLSLSSQSTGYTSIKKMLVPGSPSASKVVSVLSSGSMPQSRPKMPAADLNVIKAWIMAGALDN